MSHLKEQIGRTSTSRGQGLLVIPKTEDTALTYSCRHDESTTARFAKQASMPKKLPSMHGQRALAPSTQAGDQEGIKPQS